MSRNRIALVTGGAAAGITTLASAQDSTPPMGPVNFPIDLDSVVTSIATAGAGVLVLAFATGIGFMLVKKLKRSLTRSI